MSTRFHGLSLAVVVVFAADARLQAQAPAPAPAEAEVETAPVEIDGHVLFRLRGVSSFPAEVRARGVADRIAAAAANPALSVDSLRVVEGEKVAEVVAGDEPLLRVVDADAALEQVGRVALANTHLLRIRQAIESYRTDRSRDARIQSGIRSLGLTVLLLLGIGLVIWLWRRLDVLMLARIEKHVQTVGIQSFEVVRADQIRAALRNGVLGLRTVVLLAGVLIYLGILLALWPSTRGLSRNLVGFVLSPLNVIGDGIVRNIPSLVFLVVLFFVIRLVLRLVRLFFETVGRGTVTLKNFDAEWAEPTYKIVRVAIIAFAIIVAYPYIPGSESEAFKGVSIFIGIVFSLGSSSAIANIIAGYMMTYRRAFKVGDRVKIGEAMGDVIETRLQVTHLRTLKNEEIIIPNSQILGGDVINYSSFSRKEGLIIHTEVGIGYETPWRQVEAMLLEAAGRIEQAGGTRAFVRLKQLGDFCVTYEINAHCTDIATMMPMYTALHRHILDVFNEYGVQIMTPAYEGDPEQPKVVPPKDWFTAPAVAPAKAP